MRLYMIDDMIKRSGAKGVSFEELHEALHCSTPTLKRDLRYLRDNLKAPIEFSYRVHGYRYLEDSPRHDAFVGREATWYSPFEAEVLSTCQQLFDRVQDEKGLLSADMESLKARFFSILQDSKIGTSELKNRIVVHLEQSAPWRSPVFEAIGKAIFNRKRIQIEYRSHASPEPGLREVSPVRIVKYRGTWYLQAWSHEDKDKGSELRTYIIERVSRVVALATNCVRVPMYKVKQAFDASYGLMSGAPGAAAETAVIEVDGPPAVYAKNRVWHADQKVTQLPDGRVRIEVPYANPAELIGDIHKLGSHAVVVAPESLRKAAVEELRKTLARYGEAA
ncbi:MAG: WYL domain-containing protein [Duodenibacillus sp.]|nr:WYL domain-containing protein [Duodenibacillus sp.]